MLCLRKFAALLIVFSCVTADALADHITGGEMYYSYAGTEFGLRQYKFTMKLYMRCNNERNFDHSVISIFNRATGERLRNMNVSSFHRETIQITDHDPCISNPPRVCYEVGYYYFTVSVPDNPQGYIVAGQVNFRISNITNLIPGNNLVGATYSAEIPGTTGSPTHAENNSARFVGSDLVIVCAGNPFSYSFAGQDIDNDELSYDFCEAYNSNTAGGANASGGGNSNMPQNPPYQSVPYGNNYSGSAPLGKQVRINHNTGLITGIAPPPGIYVVTVCVTERRNGQVIAVQRKDLQVAVAACHLTAARLLPEYMLCRDTKTLSLANLSMSTLITSYDWEIRSQAGERVYSSNTPTATHSFIDTGTYSIKLVINKNDQCSDSTTALVRVYPGFKPDFDYSGVCVNKPIAFTDKTTTSYGVVNSWSWAFDSTRSTTVNTQNASFTYRATGGQFPELVASNSMGCRDTIVKSLSIGVKPPVLLAFKDTLICVTDTLQLFAGGKGTYSWTPNTQMINANTAAPTVMPKQTKIYVANLDDNGCLNSDTVLVRVTDHVDLVVMNDTMICSGDPIQLNITSNGLKYLWDHADQLSNASIANPIAITPSSSIYKVTAAVGKCMATEHITVTAVPYPVSYAGPDTTICFGASAVLQGQSSSFNLKWSPASSLDNAAILKPKATPVSTTSYVLTVYEFEGCPRPGLDTVLVTVLADMEATAGTDTSIVIGEQIQLFATGGTNYQWSPPNGLSATNIPNPTATYSEPSDLLVYRVLVSNANCFDSAFVRVKVFSTEPSVFVPTGFTPNGDGKNDVLRPIAAGIKTIERFTIYNRYGQQIFTTTTNGHGWDGRINGELQATNTYVWAVKAVDYRGRPYMAKGTTVLVR